MLVGQQARKKAATLDGHTRAPYIPATSAVVSSLSLPEVVSCAVYGGKTGIRY